MLNNNSVEKKTNIQHAFFFSFLKKPSLKKNKKIININYLLTVLIKIEAIIILGFQSLWFSL